MGKKRRRGEAPLSVGATLQLPTGVGTIRKLDKRYVEIDLEGVRKTFTRDDIALLLRSVEAPNTQPVESINLDPPTQSSLGLPRLETLVREEVAHLLHLLQASTQNQLSAGKRAELEALMGRSSVGIDATRLIPAVKRCLFELDMFILTGRPPSTSAASLKATTSPRTSNDARAAGTTKGKSDSVPSTRISRGTMNAFEPDGPLKLVHYNVGSNSPSVSERRHSLETLVCTFALPNDYSRQYREAWGRPGTSERKAHTERALQRLIDINGARSGLESAVADWRADLRWLQRCRLVRGLLTSSKQTKERPQPQGSGPIVRRRQR